MRAASDVSLSGQRLWITFTADNCPDNLHACDASDIGDDVMELQIHFHQGFLHVLDMSRNILDQTFTLTQVSPQCGNIGLRPKASTQQAIGMKLQEPSGIAHVRLATGYILGVARVHQNDVETMLLKDFINQDPVDACRFHGDTGDFAFFEPLSQRMQVGRKCAKGRIGSVVASGDTAAICIRDPISIAAAP
ncbi:hypothetical protein HK27_12070 [Acetobacter orientalis]|nr:hypothetical protein HK27_12070 [Acetobacter orientalis]